MPSENLSEYIGNYHWIDRGIVHQVVAWLCAGQTYHMLDAGCGEGAPALAFAEAGCTIEAIDADTPSVEKARRLLAAAGLADRVAFHEASILQLPFTSQQFDLAWCSRVLHHIEDKKAAIAEIRRVLKPGGRFAIREGGLPVQMLPFDFGLGTPGLESRLHVVDERWFGAMVKDTLPNELPYPFGWTQLLADTGFTDITAKTFTLDLVAPLDSAQSKYVVSNLQRSLERDKGKYGPFLAEEDRETLQKLVDPQSPHYVLKRNDLHLRYGACIYVGTKWD